MLSNCLSGSDIDSPELMEANFPAVVVFVEALGMKFF
jgi:hypothetical protein